MCGGVNPKLSCSSLRFGISGKEANTILYLKGYTLLMGVNGIRTITKSVVKTQRNSAI